jgi:hypothetical protein
MSTEGAELWREGHNRDRDEERKATLKALLEDATTPQDKVASIQAVYHKDPGVLKQHVENLTRRITGKQPQPVVSPDQAEQARIAPIAARGKTPDQQALEFNQKQGDIAGTQRLAQDKAEAQQKQQSTFDLIDRYIKDPEQNKQAKEDYVRKQAGINGTVKNLPGAAGQPYKKPNGQYVRPVLNADGTIGEQQLPADYAPPAPKAAQPKSGVSHGKNVFATLTPKGWVDAGTGEPVNDFHPAPSYAQVAPSMRAVQVVDPNDPNSTVYESIPEAIKSRAQGTQSTGYKTRAALQKAFTTGTPAQNITSINTLRGHLSLLRNAAEGLQNGNTQLFNDWAQKWAQQTGQPAPTDFQTMKVAVASELARTLTGKGATVQEISQIAQPLSIADGPEQFNQVFDDFDNQMRSRLDALQQQYDSGMQGKPAFSGTPAPKKGGHTVGEKKKFANGKTGIWDGQGWVAQ